MNVRLMFLGAALLGVADLCPSVQAQGDAIWLATPQMPAFGSGTNGQFREGRRAGFTNTVAQGDGIADRTNGASRQFRRSAEGGSASSERRERSRSGMGEAGRTSDVLRRMGVLTLRTGAFPASPGEQGSSDAVGQMVEHGTLAVWVRDPDGVVSNASVKRERSTLSVECFPPSGTPGSNGVYRVGLHLDAGVREGASGEKERVHYYATGLARRFSREGGTPQDAPPVASQVWTGFNDPERVALEIVPALTNTVAPVPGLPVSRNAGNRMGRQSQVALEENRLKVLFRGQSLAGAEVEIFSSNGWQTRLQTDGDGVVTVVPPAQRPNTREMRMSSGQCLYLVRHREATPGACETGTYASVLHCATLLLSVQNPRTSPAMDWRNVPGGFQVLLAATIVATVIVVFAVFYHRLRRSHEVMVSFDQRRLTENQA